jgi:MoaA/NifB/PqqE/SkfB family radical SAM enzyme/SAM-dependent methyltransferase
VSEHWPRAIIKVGYACNNACIFCHSSGCASIEGLERAEVCRRVEEARELGFASVLFSGGEPTIMKEFPEVASFCKGLGMPFGLITNGRMLSYRPMLDQLVTLGLEYVYLSLHGPRPYHERITRVPGSFTQTMGAIAALNRKETVATTCNVVVIQPNLDVLKDMVTLLKPLERIRLKFSYVEPKGRALEFPDILPDPVTAAQRVSRAIDFGVNQGMPSSRFAVDGLPHCLDYRYAGMQDDMVTHGIRAMREVDEKRFFPVDYGNMRKPSRCLGCVIGTECRCTWTEALNRFGDEYLRPVVGGVSNSFNYFPLPANSRPDEFRSLSLLLDGKRTVCATDTADFSKQEILAIRDESQQVYLQVDDAVELTDFPAQLQKLHRERIRGAEGNRARQRAPIFVPERRELFQQAEGRVRNTLSRMTGDVLDVGCGQVRYGEILEAKLSAGELKYTGVDPSPGDLVRKLARSREITLMKSAVEEADLGAERYDWILVLRSHNHLLDLWTAYSKLVTALRWGGLLLVVDNVAFGVVRARVTRDRIEQLPRGEGREHLRNHSSLDAERFLARFPLVREEALPVGPNSANQWLLRFRKGWPGQPARP